MLAMVKDGLFGQRGVSGFGNGVGCLLCWVFWLLGVVMVFCCFFKNRLNKCLCAIAVDISDSVLG